MYTDFLLDEMLEDEQSPFQQDVSIQSCENDHANIGQQLTSTTDSSAIITHIITGDDIGQMPIVLDQLNNQNVALKTTENDNRISEQIQKIVFMPSKQLSSVEYHQNLEQESRDQSNRTALSGMTVANDKQRMETASRTINAPEIESDPDRNTDHPSTADGISVLESTSTTANGVECYELFERTTNANTNIQQTGIIDLTSDQGNEANTLATHALCNANEDVTADDDHELTTFINDDSVTLNDDQQNQLAVPLATSNVSSVSRRTSSKKADVSVVNGSEKCKNSDDKASANGKIPSP